MLKFKNTPMLFKFLVAPVLGLVAIVGCYFLASRIMHDQSSLTTHLIEHDMASVTEINKVAGEIAALNAGFYRRLTFAAAQQQDDGKTMETMSKEISDLSIQLRDYGQRLSSPEEQALIGKTVDAMGQYGSAMTAVSSMLDLGFSAIVTMLPGFDKLNNEMQTNLKNLTEIISTSAEKAAADGQVQAATAATNFRSIVIGVVVLVLLISLLVARTVVRSINGIAGATEQLANGKLNVDIEALTRRDELGLIVESLRTFRANQEKMIRMAEEQEVMKLKADKEKRDSLAQMANALEAEVGAIIKSLSVEAGHLQHTATAMTETAQSSLDQSRRTSSASDEANTNIQTVASAAEELSASIQEISRQVGQASNVTAEAVQVATSANQRVNQFSEAAENISQIVELITNIAAQTNLLALNATIEAARAGEAGKGFAVVAGEVKNLASQTAKATEDISRRVAEIRAATEETTQEIRRVGDVIHRVSAINGSIASAVNEQNAATQEIAQSVQRASMGAEGVASGVNELNQAANNTDQAAEEVLTMSQKLLEQSKSLTDSITRFLRDVRAA